MIGIPSTWSSGDNGLGPAQSRMDFAWNDVVAVFEVRGEDAMVAGDMGKGSCHHGRGG